MSQNNLEEVRRIKKSVEENLLKKPGVNAVEVGYKIIDGKKTDELSIRIHVEKKKDVSKDEMIPPIIKGVKTDVIERTFVLPNHNRLLHKFKITPNVDVGNYNPLQGGISIGPCRIIGSSAYYGSLGILVIDNKTQAPMVLSCFHVMAVDTSWSVGDTMSQPSLADGGKCPDNVIGTLQRANLDDTTDCALASVNEQARGVICQIEDIGNIAGISTAASNASVRKRGRTTLLTFGAIESIDMTVQNIDYGDGLGKRTLTNQIGIEPDISKNKMFLDDGDSGAVVVDDSSQVIGLLFSGSPDGHGIANPIQAVLNALDANICS